MLCVRRGIGGNSLSSPRWGKHKYILEAKVCSAEVVPLYPDGWYIASRRNRNKDIVERNILVWLEIDSESQEAPFVSCCIVHDTRAFVCITDVHITNFSPSSADPPSRYRASVVAMIPSIRLLDGTPIALPWRARVAAEISRYSTLYLLFQAAVYFPECVMSKRS